MKTLIKIVVALLLAFIGCIGAVFIMAYGAAHDWSVWACMPIFYAWCGLYVYASIRLFDW